MPDTMHRFAEALRSLLDERNPQHFDAAWDAEGVDALGWSALARAVPGETPAWESTLDEADGLLLRLLDRVPRLASGPTDAARHIATFRLPQLERLQHATAAALVGLRYGAAGLATVVADRHAPRARRYFAFLGLAERHPPREWPIFARYLVPDAHHAFVGAAAEAARFYPETDAATLVIRLFRATWNDRHLRTFLAPRILRSLYELADPATLPFLRDILVAGYTHRDPLQCEVTQALLAVERLTGVLEPSSKFPTTTSPAVRRRMQDAERRWRREARTLAPVTVI
jgi:hypothetical protein